MVEPPFWVPHDFIDYPLFMNLGLLQNAAMLEKLGARVSVVDAIFSAESFRITHGDNADILGMGVSELSAMVAKKLR